MTKNSDDIVNFGNEQFVLPFQFMEDAMFYKMSRSISPSVLIGSPNMMAMQPREIGGVVRGLMIEFMNKRRK